MDPGKGEILYIAKQADYNPFLIMETKYFKKANFWARELRLPLFWLTDPEHEIFKDKALIFYKNNR